VLLFLGGWWTGIAPVVAWVSENLGSFTGQLLGFVVITIKTSKLVFVQIWIRWTLPRLRIDQVMQTCLKYLVPIACALFLGAAVWSIFLPGRTFFGFRPGLGERAVATVDRSDDGGSSFSGEPKATMLVTADGEEP
jgi:NADH-quinone oxidoreductase subunit H